MREALVEAARGLGRTHPNPSVGAVIVNDGVIVGRGFHQKAGAAHAEVMALRAAGKKARGATAYVTLEPCGHQGKTPPCSVALLKAGISRVVYASRDPNPLVNGRGLRELKTHGVLINGPLLQTDADALNRPFFKFMQTGLPFVTLKVASTLDGKLATAAGESKWLSSEPSRLRVHQLRNRVDAILIGANTARLDDPLLTTRLPRTVVRNAVRIVVDGSLSISARSQLVKTARQVRTIVATMAKDGSARVNALKKVGVEVWSFKRSAAGIDVTALLRRVAQAKLLHVLVEGGAQIHAQFIKAGQVDELVQFVVPRLLGHEANTWSGQLNIERIQNLVKLQIQRVERVGQDVMIVSSLEPAMSARA